VTVDTTGRALQEVFDLLMAEVKERGMPEARMRRRHPVTPRKAPVAGDSYPASAAGFLLTLSRLGRGQDHQAASPLQDIQ
jgi:hypothetical protein